MDGRSIVDGRHAHSTFSNISFLNAEIKNTNFINCTFVDCYFRNASLTSCQFTGCKFVNCNFGRRVAINGGDFRYARFDGCIIRYSDLQYSMPREPNLRMMLAQELSVVAENLGQQDEARKYRLDFLSARKDHLLARVRGENQWYRDHFGTLERLAALLTLFWYFVNALLWKHGEGAMRLFVSAVVVVFGIFPLLYAIVDPGRNVYADLTWLSLSNFLLLDRLYTGTLANSGMAAWSAVEAALGIIFAGMYVMVLIKALLRR